MTYDIVIIGTGAGGGTLAYTLKDSGMQVLLVERGDFLPQEPENWQPEAVFDRKRYKPKETWYDANSKPFAPGVHYFVGGNTKVYGAALPRLRHQDFEALEHEGGTSPAWPIRYEDLEPYYARAERIYGVHGAAGDDPTEPPRSTPFPFPAVPHEPYIEDVVQRLRAQGLHPFGLPMGIDLRDPSSFDSRSGGSGGRCIRCKTCDGFPCKVHAKSEADVCCVRPAIQHKNIELMTRAYARRLITDPSGRHIQRAQIERDGQQFEIAAHIFVVACGAVNSTALLLRSANDRHPNGLANSSRLLGRNYMVHNNTAVMAVHPTRVNATVFQKTMAVNDFYFKNNLWSYPMGNLQLLGKLQAGMLTANQPLVPKPILQAMANRSIDWWVMSEDLPDPNNCVILAPDGGIVVHWKPNNRVAHRKLIEAAREMLRAAGYPVVLTQTMGIATNSHMCGTLRFGNDPATSVLDPFCKTWDIENLFVVDSSFFPSSAAVNPALTIAAQALRVGDHLTKHA
jgi:choline dehydrogenase-like flavoprotein